MAEQLEIVIGANVDDAKAGINSLGQTVTQFAQQGKVSIASLEQALVSLRSQIKVATDPAQAQQLSQSFKVIQDQLNNLKLTEGLSQQLGGITRAARLAHSDVDELSRSISLFAAGNQRGVDTISQVLFSFQRLEGVAGGLKGALGEIVAVFTGPAGIAIAISTAINVISPFISKLFETTEAQKEAAEAAKKLKEAVTGIFEGQAKEATEVLSLIAVLKDETETRERKLAAIEKLNKIAPETFNNLRLEGNAVTNLDSDYKNYLASLETVIAAKIKQLQLEGLVTQLLEKQGVTATGFAKGIQDANRTLDEQIRKKQAAGEALNSLELIRVEQAKKEQEDLKKINDQIDGLQKDLITLSHGIKVDVKVTPTIDDVKLTEAQRKVIELAKLASNVFDVPLPLRFEISDSAKEEFKKAQDIIKGIEDHTIRLKFISLTETKGIEAELKDIQVPKLELKINEAGFKESINALVKGLVIPVSTKLDEPSLLETEDQIKKVFSGFTDTNIFTEAGRNAGNKFREALLQSVKIFDKGFTINPNIDVTDVIASLTASLAGIKDIQLKVIKTETFDDAIRTLRDLHDAGVEAGNAVEKAFIDAGRSTKDAVAAGKAVENAFGGITKQAADVAKVVDTTLTSAFQDFFKAIETGKNPIKAFFEAIINSVEQVASKLIGSAIEKALLSLITTSSGLTTAVSASAVAISAASAAAVGAAGTAAAAAAGAATAAVAAQAAAAAALIAAAAAKIALASVNPLSLLGLVGLGFAEGGDPPVNKPSIVGEKGWELFVPKVPGTIYSHADSMKLVSNASVKEHESIKEYLIAEKISQQVKEHFNAAFRSIESSVKILATNNEKLATYSYQLHNNIQSLKESFADRSSTDTIQKLNESVNNLKESFVSISDKTTINNSVEKLTESVNNFKESSTDNNRFERLNQLVSELKESFVSVTIERLQSTGKESFSDKSSVIEKFASTSTISDRVNNTESFDKIVSLITGNSIEKLSATSSDHSVNNYKESFDKANTSIKETISYLTASINDKSATIDKSSHYETSFTSSMKELQSLTASSIDRFHESIINNNLTSSIDKLYEKISERSDKSVHIERIINNNFFTSESLKESFKSMSISDLQRTFNIPAFAQGGAVFGPTLAILGEGFGISRSNPEFVGTASQLKGIHGGQFDVNVSVGGELSFSMGKLAIALNREVRSQLRTNGKPPF